MDELIIENSYSQVFELLSGVINSIKGMQVRDNRWLDLEPLSLKLFAHSATCWQLRNGTSVNTKFLNSGLFFDFSSTTVLARAAFETYLKIFNIYFLKKTDDEFEFDYVVWQLSGHVQRVSYGVPEDSESEASYTASKEYVDDLITRLRATKRYESLNIEQRRKAEGGKSTRNMDRQIENARMDTAFFKRIYSYHSSYVHSDSIITVQLGQSKSLNDQRQMLYLNLTFVLVLMSKLVENYVTKFKPAKLIAKQQFAAYQKAKFFIRLSKEG